MRKFQVSVNGKTYQVEVEELTGGASTVAPVPTVSATPAAPTPVAVPVPENATKVVAPMPGKIVDVKVSIDQEVKEGDLIAVLEAMKMENEVFANQSGKVASVNVTAGAMVEANDVIVTIS